MKKIFNEIGGGYKEPVKAFQIGGPLGGVVPVSYTHLTLPTKLGV